MQRYSKQGGGRMSSTAQVRKRSSKNILKKIDLRSRTSSYETNQQQQWDGRITDESTSRSFIAVSKAKRSSFMVTGHTQP